MSDNSQKLLRYALRGNALFSMICGTTLLFAGQRLSAAFGIEPAWLLRVTGFTLVIFAAGLIMLSLRDAMNRTAAASVVLLDAGWVLGSAIILLLPLALTATGWWTIAIVAEIVGMFAVLQFVGLRKASITGG